MQNKENISRSFSCRKRSICQLDFEFHLSYKLLDLKKNIFSTRLLSIFIRNKSSQDCVQKIIYIKKNHLKPLKIVENWKYENGRGIGKTYRKIMFSLQHDGNSFLRSAETVESYLKNCNQQFNYLLINNRIKLINIKQILNASCVLLVYEWHLTWKRSSMQLNLTKNSLFSVDAFSCRTLLWLKTYFKIFR